MSALEVVVAGVLVSAPVQDLHTGHKITVGHWPISEQYIQMAYSIAKWLVPLS